MKHFVTAIMLLLAAQAFAAPNEPLHLGILANRPRPLAMAQWQPLADYLQATLKRPVELSVYDHDGLNAAAARRAVDVVLTSPGHFIHLQQTTGLSAPLATLISRERGHELSAFGGVVFTRSDRADITALADLAGKRLAAVSLDAFGSYQTQAFELLDAGIPLPTGDRLLLTALPQDRVVAAVLGGRADAGFVRAGILDSMAQEGKLDLNQVKIINRQHLPDFPYAVSTRLYPEWPVAVMPQVDQTLAVHLTAALLVLSRNSFQGPAAAISGFTIPASYTGVENLLRRLRLPPFDHPPEITLADLWHRYTGWILSLTGLLLLLSAASLALVVLYRRSRTSLHEVARLAKQEQLLLASLAEGVFGVDPGERCIFINPGALAMLGFAEQEVLGQDTHGLFHGSKENGSLAARESCPILLTLRDGRKRAGEDIFVCQDGSRLPVSFVVSAMRDGDAIVGAVVAFQDITARKQAEKALKSSEARFRRLAENARDAIYRMKLPDGVYEYISPAATELFGYAPEEFYTEPDMQRKLIHPDWHAYLATEWEKLLRGEMPPTYEFQIIHKSGAIRWMNQRNILVRDDQERIIAIEGIVTDVTDKKQNEEALRSWNEELEQRVRERTAALEAKTAELERANKLFVGRELRMVELKNKIMALEKKSGKTPPPADPADKLAE